MSRLYEQDGEFMSKNLLLLRTKKKQIS